MALKTKDLVKITNFIFELDKKKETEFSNIENEITTLNKWAKNLHRYMFQSSSELDNIERDENKAWNWLIVPDIPEDVCEAAEIICNDKNIIKKYALNSSFHVFKNFNNDLVQDHYKKLVKEKAAVSKEFAAKILKAATQTAEERYENGARFVVSVGSYVKFYKNYKDSDGNYIDNIEKFNYYFKDNKKISYEDFDKIMSILAVLSGHPDHPGDDYTWWLHTSRICNFFNLELKSPYELCKNFNNTGKFNDEIKERLTKLLELAEILKNEKSKEYKSIIDVFETKGHKYIFYTKDEFIKKMEDLKDVINCVINDCEKPYDKEMAAEYRTGRFENHKFADNIITSFGAKNPKDTLKILKELTKPTVYCEHHGDPYFCTDSYNFEILSTNKEDFIYVLNKKIEKDKIVVKQPQENEKQQCELIKKLLDAFDEKDLSVKEKVVSDVIDEIKEKIDAEKDLSFSIDQFNYVINEEINKNKQQEI